MPKQAVLSMSARVALFPAEHAPPLHHRAQTVCVDATDHKHPQNRASVKQIMAYEQSMQVQLGILALGVLLENGSRLAVSRVECDQNHIRERRGTERRPNSTRLVGHEPF